jgi:transcriptional regulator with GAF, ATPase, and Fis domain
MEARLVALSGPLEGAVYPLEAELSIGREKTNGIAVEDRVLSRRHCVIHRDNEQFAIRDLNSSNGTYVNGLPATTRILKDGDQIKAGQSLFLFVHNDGIPMTASLPLELAAGNPMAAATVLLKAQDALYLHPRNLPRVDGALRNLEILLKIGSALASIRGLEPLQRKLLDLILEVIPGDRGAILVAGEAPDEFASVCQFSSSSQSKPIQVSRTIIEQVMREKVALLSNDVLQGGAINLTESVIKAHIRSLLAVPLIAFGKSLGVIYVDSQSARTRFEEDHLQLLTGIAGMAAVALENALFLDNLQHENLRLKAEINVEHDMVGSSPRMRHVYDFVGKVAPSASTVLIRGESGTGKELVARAIHRNSPRASKPFVAINCAALTEALLESELFGHERGAFTGAVTQKKGKLEEASGGSVFLDELGELAPALQAKLLRVLQEREFERVGGIRPIKADIRLIAATNRDLEDAVRNGAFRRDLYYRLNVVSIVLPPLRERREDIASLANHFVRKHARNTTRQVMGISEEARSCLACYDWPGNVRELENAMERAVVLGSTELILPEDLPESVVEANVLGDASSGGFHELVRDAKKEIVLKVLADAGGSYTEAAKRLHLHPSNLHRLIRTLNLKEDLNK